MIEAEVEWKGEYPLKKPTWYNLEVLPVYLRISRKQLKESREQLENLENCKNKPHLLNDYIIDRIIKVFSEQNDSVWVLVEQCNRWSKNPLRTEQLNDTIEIKNNVTELTRNNEKILELAKNFKNHTINRVLERNDCEIEIDSLLNKA